MLRLIGFAGILVLAVLTAFVLAHAISERDLKGIALMLFFAGMLVFFARLLWLGRERSRIQQSQPLAAGWAGQPVGVFLREQVAQSPEGRVLIIGVLASLVAALLSMLSPELLPYSRKPEWLAVLFGMWPMLSFVLYVRICGPDFRSSVSKVLAVLSVVAAPFVLAVRLVPD